MSGGRAQEVGVWETPCDNAKVFGKFLPDASGKNSAKERVKAEVNGNPGGKRQSWRWRSPYIKDESKQICLGVGWGWDRLAVAVLPRPHTALPSLPSPHCQLPEAGRTETVRPRSGR